ncbi:InlB B-repeat-containing protein, partial [Bifidobacterium adolescentis]|nr:InlB B-repeat-containing protein [Bifidobacterium adolescentis]MDB1446933.1 InlB B-repeat-containing protein [Bifidobacterium adolescentis]MDB1448804.1 InlB B-repeat-containing protein [Bifidobacterium adolescentis]MDB1450675.1 InlB B-repeat-containing protein [Bifidobacterium adolescentis]
AGLLAASTLGTGLAGTANAVDVTGAAGTTKSVVKLTADGGNETSEDTADNPDDDSTDADSTTDAGAQSAAGQQAEIQSSTSQDKATAKSSLPDHIVNGSFDYPACPDGKNSCDVDPTTGWGGFYVDYGRKFMPIPDWNRSKFGWDSSQEGLRPDQQPNSHQKLQHCVQIGNKPNNNGQKMNRFAEIIAETPDEYIYQDIATTPGVMYRWSLKHASEDASHVDSMQVTIGSPGKETAQDATRTTSNGRGDRTGVTSKTIATKGGQAEWETYTGVYIATSTVTRFTFKSAQGRDSTRGNFIDDVMFTKAYKLTYDKNSADASGQVPSNQRGKENTTHPAKNKTNGKIRLASDTSKLSDHLVNSDFEYLPDGGWKTVDAPSYMTNAYTSVDPNNGQYMRNAKHVDADLASWVDWPGFDQSKFAWKTDQKGGHDQGGLKDRANAVELQQDSTDGNTYAEMVASETGRTIYQDIATIPGTLYKIRLKHASLCKDNVDQMQVVINGTPIEMTRVTANGKAGDKVGEKSTTIGTRVTNENRWHHSDQWETYEGYYVIPDGQTTTRFGFKAVNYLDPTKGNLLDDVTFARAYKLSYDKNSTDATGEVPSNQRGKENTTQPAKTKTSGTVKTVADENVRYGSLANGDFSYPSFSDIQKNEQENAADLRTFLKSDDGTLWYNMSSTDLSKYGKIGQIPGFDSSRFAWSSTENGSRVELQQDRNTKNTYAEIVAQQDNTSIYQNVSTGNGGVLYKIRLKHASRQSSHADRMQVLVGSDTAHATPVEMTRVTSNGHGDKVGGKSTIITTKVSNTDPRDHGSQWETYEGYYQVPEGQKNAVFMFKSLEGFKEYETLSGNNIGNLVDDIEFSRSYKLTYDANSSDASGQVPSDSPAYTVKQAKARTTGTVRAVADRTASGLTVHDLKNGEIAPVQYGDFKFSTTDGFTADQITDVNGFDVKTNWDPTEENQAYAGKTLSTMYQPNENGANLILHHVGQWRDSSGTQRWLNARITVNGQNLGSLVYLESKHEFRASYGKWDLHPSSRPYMDVTVDFLLDDGSTPQGLRGATGFTDIDGGTSGYNEGVELVSGFDGAYVRSDAHLARFGTNGWAGITDENKNNADAHGMKHYVGATFTGSSFRVRWSVASGQARQSGFQPVDSTIAYRLTYDKNAQDATGSIPSDTAANTTRPAKSETDGKVSDLVQRTTTHEDGSVTVKTIDTSTDVVSGCQVYYPAGQRITLATMAKDDDCWDSSMLSRPGHTQLGWNQDRNATQAQAQVTMVEGGMTVYAVWVGNPVLTYDTNKPSTWSGQMPSTPASVSVPYNTAAADGSGWQSGDTTKIKGYRFLGWYTTPQDGSNLYDWNTPLTGSVTVYAHWQRLQANVIYNANGGTGSHPNTTGWQYSDVTIPGDTSKSFKRDGYYFKYWNTQKDGKGTTYKDGGQVPLQDKDVTLYAIWAPYHTVITETGGVGLPVLVAAGMGLLVVGIGSTVMLTRRMRGEQ